MIDYIIIIFLGICGFALSVYIGYKTKDDDVYYPRQLTSKEKRQLAKRYRM